MAHKYREEKTPYSEMRLPKLKEIEADILNKNPDLERRLNLYHEEEKKRMKLRKEHEGIRNRIAEIRSSALRRKQRKYATAGTLKKFFMDKITPTYTGAEKAEIERLQAQLAKFRRGHNPNKYRSAYETHAKLVRVQILISQKEKEHTKKNK